MNRLKIVKQFSLAAVVLFVLVLFFTTCKDDQGIPDYNSYPDEVGRIMFTRCATTGCHNDKSKGAAGGLSLETWDKLFEGGSGSACVIPYSKDFSTLCYYTNTFPELGITLEPTMPYNREKLSINDVLILQNWIADGAPNRNGFVKFSDNPNRRKYYVCNQGCDVVTVFDAATKLPMRYIKVGSSLGIESPHMIKVSPDGQYWYVIFINGSYLEKYRTADDGFVSRVYIGSGSWNTFAISSDSRFAYCVDFSNVGLITSVDLDAMSAQIQGGFATPHGSALNSTNDILYVTQNTNSSKIYKIPVADFSAYSEVNLYSTLPMNALNTHEIRFTPDGTKYIVTCQGTSEVRIMQTNNDSLLAIIPVGAWPSEIAFSISTNYVFITCQEDDVNCPLGGKGSVAVVDYVNNSFVQYIYTGYQPHGIEVDDDQKIVVVANANFSTNGPAPHHTSNCGGRNGNVAFINLNTLTVITQPESSTPKRVEVSVYPYSVSIRH